MMGTLSVAHPDIADFVESKARAGALPRFNLSVQLSDAFLAAVEADAGWTLFFGSHSPRRVRARELWDRVLQTMLQWSEPGVLFVDTINRENNLGWREHLTTTNPCGEAPLPAYGACNLGSINLAALAREPFSDAARILAIEVLPVPRDPTNR